MTLGELFSFPDRDKVITWCGALKFTVITSHIYVECTKNLGFCQPVGPASLVEGMEDVYVYTVT